MQCHANAYKAHKPQALPTGAQLVFDTGCRLIAYRIAQVVANGDGSSALVLGAIFGQTFTAEAAAISADPCTQDGFIAAARERIITRLNGLDATTYPSTAYLLQSSCAFADLANVPADLTLAAAQAVGQFLSAHVDALLTNQWQVRLAGL